MQAKLVTYEHSENGISVFVMPETEAERVLLKGLWKHGKMQSRNGIADNNWQVFSVDWYLKEEKPENTASGVNPAVGVLFNPAVGVL